MTPVAHLEREHRAPGWGGAPLLPPPSCPLDTPSGTRAPTVAACPPPRSMPVHPSIHPSVCPLLTSVSTLCHPGWLGAGLQASWEECGRHAGSSLPGRQPQGPAQPRPLRVCLQSWAGPRARLQG